MASVVESLVDEQLSFSETEIGKKRFFYKFTMDYDDLMSTDAPNNVKASTKFKPKPKPKPKPKSQPEPKSTPTPPAQPVEAAAAAASADDEITGRTEEEQPFDANEIPDNANDDWQSSFIKPHEENGESYLTLESLNDVLLQSITVTDTPTIHVSMDENIEKGPTEPDLESLAQIDPLTGGEASICNDNEDFQMENPSSDIWEPLDNLSESRTCAGPKVGKFKPKPKAQTRNVENTYSVPPQMDYMDYTSIPSSTPDELLGSSSIGIIDSVPTEAIDFHVTEEPLTFTEMSQVESVIPSEQLDAIPEIPAVGHKTVKKGKSQSSEPGPESQGGRSSERLRKQPKKSLALVDEFENEDITNDIVHGKEDNNNNNNNNIDDYTPENEASSERKGKKSKKQVNEKEKPVRKRKKASEVPVEPTKVKKKFPHSTRRNRRPVNPELLEKVEKHENPENSDNPGEELDLSTYPLKDLIRLAEHRERIAKKEASTSGTPALNQSGGSISNNFDSEHDGFEEGTDFGEGTGKADYIMEAENVTYYNYRTHMKITPRMKWSKQDTELFFEAVQQFGTDLSMIKECFPGRTREQIKSKYKKEEKQHPLRLNDALTTRFKGNSHFEQVIERLKQANGKDCEDEDPMNLTGEENEDDVATNINDTDETTKGVVNSEKKDEEMEGGGDVPAVGSPTKSHDSEDEMYLWSQYKSEI